MLAEAACDVSGRRRYRMRPSAKIVETLRLAYGPMADHITERRCRSLTRVMELLSAGEDARARIHAVLLGFPEIAPEAMAKLARAAGLEKYNPDWEDQSRVPPGNSDGGQWTGDGAGFEIAARGDLPCQGCASGGSYGTTGMFRIEGKILCWDCAVKAAGVQNEPGPIKIETLQHYLLDRKE
jgi:hypothetical protein